MKRSILLVIGWLITLLLSCDTQGPVPTDPGNRPNYPPGTATEVGKSIGPATTQTIGPEGGTLTSADGKITLTVPGGALDKSVALSVEPIENTAPIGIGTSYRISPEETRFSKDVMLDYQYSDSDINGADTDHLGVAIQQPDRRWAMTRRARQNKTTRKISTRLRKAGKTSLVSNYVLHTPHSEVIPGEEARISLRYVEKGFEATTTDDEVFVPIPTLGDLHEIRDFFVNGSTRPKNSDGSIFLKPNPEKKAVFYYRAPAKLPAKSAREVTVSVTLLKEPGKQLDCKFKIVSAGTLMIDGEKYEDVDVSIRYSKHENGVGYFVRFTEPTKKARISEFTVGLYEGFNAAGTYTLKGGFEQMQKSTFIVGGPASDGNGTYSTLYFEENGAEIDTPVFDPTTLIVQEFEHSDTLKFSSGTVSCNLYRETKRAQSVKVSATFRSFHNK